MVFEGDADIVIVPAIEGEMGILPNHAPLLSTLQFGVLRVRFEGVEQVFSVAGGVIEVQPDLITVLADVAENVDEIDIDRAEEARRQAERTLAEGPQIDADTYMAVQAALRRSNLRIDAVARFRRDKRLRQPGIKRSEDE
jgi:F-type H+-transporting ATPase subunit epsilon